MKVYKYLFILCGIILCLQSCDPEKRELYSHIDYFIEQLNSRYESYGFLGSQDDTRYTDDGTYKVMPIGRLINVRIEHVATDKEYEKLLNDLETHYKNDSRVNKVYRCAAGTLMIDCRK